MKKIRLLSIIICLVFVVTCAFTGCGSTQTSKDAQSSENSQSKPAEQASTAKETPEEPALVRVIMPGRAIDDTTDPKTGTKTIGTNTKMKVFTDANPNIKVEFEETTWDNAAQKATTMSASGEVDILGGMGPYIFKTNDWCQDVTDLYNKDKAEISNNYISDFSSLMITDKNEVKALLMLNQPFFITYSKKIFDDYGVEYLSESPTYEEILTKATKLTGKDPKTGKQTYGLAGQTVMGKYGMMVVLEDLIYYFDAKFYEMNSPYYVSADWKTAKVVAGTNANFKTAVQACFDLMKLMPPGTPSQEGAENYYNDQNNVAIQLPTQYFGPYEKEIASGKTDFYDKYGVCTEMKRPSDGTGCYLNTGYVGMAKAVKPEKRDACWKVMKYLISKDFNYTDYTTLVLPCIQKGMETYRYPADKSYDTLIKNLQTLPKDQMGQSVGPGAWAAEGIVVDDAFKALQGQKVDVAETIKKVEASLTKELANQLAKEK